MSADLIAHARTEVKRTLESGEWFPRTLVSALASELEQAEARIADAVREYEMCTLRDLAEQRTPERMHEILTRDNA